MKAKIVIMENKYLNKFYTSIQYQIQRAVVSTVTSYLKPEGSIRIVTRIVTEGRKGAAARDPILVRTITETVTIIKPSTVINQNPCSWNTKIHQIRPIINPTLTYPAIPAHHHHHHNVPPLNNYVFWPKFRIVIL